MLTMKYFILTLMMVLLLVSCQKQLSYSYLMRHPEVLKKEIKLCESDDVISFKDKEKIKYCQMVILAAENMLSILNQQQENPEKFGERLLTLQIAASNTKIALDEAEKTLIALQKQQAATDKINDKVNKAKVNRDRFKKLYDEQREEIKVMLAVIGVNTPG